MPFSDCELSVKVQGPRPENMLFFVHEVFESLISESFHGVKYDYFVPCPDCLNDVSGFDDVSAFNEVSGNNYASISMTF